MYYNSKVLASFTRKKLEQNTLKLYLDQPLLFDPKRFGLFEKSFKAALCYNFLYIFLCIIIEQKPVDYFPKK